MFVDKVDRDRKGPGGFSGSPELEENQNLCTEQNKLQKDRASCKNRV